MKKKRPITPWALVIHVLSAFGILALCSILYFYSILPTLTNHEKYVIIPDLTGITLEELDQFLAGYRLRYEVSDSSYSEKMPPLTVLKQFPRAGKQVKYNRKIHLTINQITPPTVLVPDVIDQSRINARAVFQSNNLEVGEIIWVSSPFFSLIKEMHYQGMPIEPGTPVPKGSAIDLVVGDGEGSSTFKMRNLIGASYEQVISKLEEWNLHIGNVELPVGIDTENTVPIVYKQYPEAGELIYIGDSINIWLAPAGYEPVYTDEAMK